jgi:hypothetical protein
MKLYLTLERRAHEFENPCLDRCHDSDCDGSRRLSHLSSINHFSTFGNRGHKILDLSRPGSRVFLEFPHFLPSPSSGDTHSCQLKHFEKILVSQETTQRIFHDLLGIVKSCSRITDWNGWQRWARSYCRFRVIFQPELDTLLCCTGFWTSGYVRFIRWE